MRTSPSTRRPPQPPTNPPVQDSVGEHTIEYTDDPILDLDGPSKAEAEQHDDEILAVAIKAEYCDREGCDAAHKVRYYYTMNGVESVRKLHSAYTEWAAHPLDKPTADEYAEFIWSADTQLVMDGEQPILHVGGTYIRPTDKHVERDDRGGECYGEVDEATARGI